MRSLVPRTDCIVRPTAALTASSSVTPSQSACDARACAAAGRAPGLGARAWRTAAHLRCAVRHASAAPRTVAKRTAGAACTAALAASRRRVERTEGRTARRTPRRSAFATGVDTQQHRRGAVQGGLVQSFRRDAGAAGRGRRHQPRLGGPARGTCRLRFSHWRASRLTAGRSALSTDQPPAGARAVWRVRAGLCGHHL